MTDALQHSLHTAAVTQPLLCTLAVLLANDLIVLLALLFLGMLWLNRQCITWQTVARMLLSGGLSLLLVFVLGRVIQDPRPYLAEHYAPLAHVATDNGFPSDHTLVVALLTGWALWIDRRWVPVFLAGVLGVMLGRLGIGAHHTLDVLGSVLIATFSCGLAGLLNVAGRGQTKIWDSWPQMRRTPTA